jgi:P4 family phage/plasmid primase-like protien
MTERFYVYQDGAWRVGDGPIAAEIVRLLGNRYRNTQQRSIFDVLRYQPGTGRITCEPLPQYINVPNGMVDWATRKILPHDPALLSTVQLGVEYDSAAKCPSFDDFLTEVLPEDCIQFIWEIIGYTFYSGNPLHAAILLYGNGRNGKGTLIRVLKRILGVPNISAVKLHELIENRFRTATLYGKLANLAGDLDAKWLANTAVFKAITGGDILQAETKFGAPFDFTPWATPFYSTNKPFGSSDSSEGWVSRWTIVPFPNSFADDPDRKLDVTLQTDQELRGVLAKGIAALPELMRRGQFLSPDSVTTAKADFILASDQVRAWIDEHCERDPEAWEPRTPLYQRCHSDASWDKSKPLNRQDFYNRMEQIGGISKATINGNRGFKGIRLKGAGLRAARPAASGDQRSWSN